MQRQRILVVEDDAKTADTLRLYLEHAGYGVGVAGDGAAGLDAARHGRFDLVVLDLMLPELAGEAVCRTLRTESTIPIIMLTARTTTADRIDGLELGADDYVTKPFSPRELVARIRSVLRRARPTRPGSGRLRAGELELDLDQSIVLVDGRQVPLTRIELAILTALARARGRVLTRQSLIERAFGHEYDALERTIDAHIMKLRKKIEPDRRDPRYVLTVFGVGYRLATDGG